MRPPAQDVDDGSVHRAAVHSRLSQGVGNHGASQLPGAHTNPVLDTKGSNHVNYGLPGKIYLGIHKYSVRLAHHIPALIAIYTHSSCGAVAEPNRMYAPQTVIVLCSTDGISHTHAPGNTAENDIENIRKYWT